MTQVTLKKRYGLNNKQLIEALQNSLPELNKDGEHAVVEGNHWTLDDVAVERLDEIMHYMPDLPVQTTDNSKNALKAENDDLKAKVETLQDCLLKAEATLKQTIETHNKEKQDYENQLEELTRQVYATQEGQKNISDSLIRKYKSEADKANMALEYEKQKAEDKIATQTRLIDELQSREQDYNEKLGKFLELRNEYLKLQTEMTVSGEEQQKLLRNLREKNDYISKLEDVINTAKATNNDNAMANSLLVKDVNSALSNFITIISSLQESVTSHAISSDSKKALVSKIESVSNRQRKMMGYNDAPAETEEEAAIEENADANSVNTADEASQEVPQETAQAPKQPETTPEVSEEKSSEKGPERFVKDNVPRDAAIDTLRKSQEKLREEILADNELRKKGLLARVASWFLA